MTFSNAKLGACAVFAAMAVAAPAWAHHVMGGELPQTFLQGLLSGLAHPVIGLDHLAAIVGVGILAALAGRGVGPVLAFSAAMIAGVAIHLGKVDIPASELLVGLSTIAIGGLVILGLARWPARTTGLTVVGILVAVAGGATAVATGLAG